MESDWINAPLTKREQAIKDLLWDYLKRDPDHKDRRQTGFGTKTVRGLAACIARVMQETEEPTQAEVSANVD